MVTELSDVLESLFTNEEIMFEECLKDIYYLEAERKEEILVLNNQILENELNTECSS